jgi:FdhD protein
MPRSEGEAAVEVAARAYAYDNGAFGPLLQRAVAVEAPIEILFGGTPFAVMMATPRDLRDFAFGFAFTEGVVERLADIRGVEIQSDAQGWRVNIALSAEKLRTHLARARSLVGRTGCGLCGVEDLSQLPKVASRPAIGPPIEPAAIGAAIRALDERQVLNRRTHAVHAAAWCGRDGALDTLREDVGRHNALDKTIGALLQAGARASDGFFVITSRCSFEMVAKAAAFGAGALVSVSAPTSMAIERAESCGLALIAVAREDQALDFANGPPASTGEIAA